MRKHLANRAKWQGFASVSGLSAEDAFTAIMSLHLRDEPNIVTSHKPKDLRGCYGTRKAKTSKRESPHGVIPEFSIFNEETGKGFFVEIKRQKPEGNAHERACKFFMPRLISAMQDASRQPATVIPMWFLFTNGIARDPYYRQEIQFWFQGYERNMTFWERLRDYETITNHFDDHIRPLLQ